MGVSKIRSVRIYRAEDDLHITMYSVSYKCGRRIIYWGNHAPKTVLHFINRADRVVLYMRDYEVVG